MKNILTPFKYKSRYLGIGLRGVGIYNNNENRKTFKVHYLIAVTYLPNPENKKTINHIDKNIENNNISNLEWATSKEQIDHQQTINPPSYKNTSKIGTNNLSNIYDIKIGRRYLSGMPYFFNGKIDDIAIYNRALSEQEITALYTSTPTSGTLASTKVFLDAP
jgi:hypothetical protein